MPTSLFRVVRNISATSDTAFRSELNISVAQHLTLAQDKMDKRGYNRLMKYLRDAINRIPDLDPMKDALTNRYDFFNSELYKEEILWSKRSKRS